MIFFVFGKFGISIFPIGKNSTFVPKIGDFSSRKRFSDFFFFNCSLDEMEKNPLLFRKFGNLAAQKVALIELKIGTYIVQIG